MHAATANPGTVSPPSRTELMLLNHEFRKIYPPMKALAMEPSKMEPSNPQRRAQCPLPALSARHCRSP